MSAPVSIFDELRDAAARALYTAQHAGDPTAGHRWDHGDVPPLEHLAVLDQAGAVVNALLLTRKTRPPIGYVAYTERVSHGHHYREVVAPYGLNSLTRVLGWAQPAGYRIGAVLPVPVADVPLPRDDHRALPMPIGPAGSSTGQKR